MAEPSDNTKKTANSMLSRIGKSALGGAKKVVSSVGKLFTKKPENVIPHPSGPTETLGEIFKMMKIMDEDRRANQEMANAHIEEQKHEKDRRNDEIIKALTARKKPKPKKEKKVEEKKPEEKKPEEKKPEEKKAPEKKPPEKKVEEKKVEEKKPKETAEKVKEEKKTKETTEKVKEDKVKKQQEAEKTITKKENVVSPVPKTVSPSTTTKVAGAAIIAGTAATNAAASVRRIVEVGPGYNIIETPDGSIIKQEGAWNWRNNNPGNIEYGDYALKMGAIPFKQGQNKSSKPEERFAVFPTYEIGRRAKAGLIFEGKNYKDLNIDAAIARYAPPKENNTVQYQTKVKEALMSTGLSVDEISTRKMASYNDVQQSAILNAMEKMEGYGSGKKQSKILQPAPQTPSQNGTQIEQSSKTNADMKKDMNSQQLAMNQQNVNVVNQNINQPEQGTPTKPNDTNPLLAKVKGQPK